MPLRPADQVSVTIDRLAYGGEGVGRIADPGNAGAGLVVFVDKTAPGDTVLARIRRVHRRHAEADLIAVHTSSATRVTPRCAHFNEGCGGCAWQHLAYSDQLSAKENLVRESLERIGGFRDLPFSPIIAAGKPWHFRNKMDFAFHPQGGLGLHPRGSWDTIVALQNCYLPSPLAVDIVKSVRAWALSSGQSLYDPRTHQGLLRGLVIRESQLGKEMMVGLVTSEGTFAGAGEFANLVTALSPTIVSVVRGISALPSDGSPLEKVVALMGRTTITERLAGFDFQIGLGTFFQTNTAQADRLVDTVRSLMTHSYAADPSPRGGLLVDVFCGVGVFSLALATHADVVAGVEIAPAAVEAARANAQANNISNANFYVGDARTTLPELLARHGQPRVVVLDPPRAGAGGKVMRRIARAGPEHIIYISCNPTTLARDLQQITPFGYRMTAVQPVDMFPHTYHVETVVALSR